MAKTVEFFYDFGSPASYLAFKRLPGIAAERGATIVWRPMLLGGVFKASGNTSPVTVPAKGKWMAGDLQRWAAKSGVPFAFNPFFPVNTLTLMRGATGLQMRQPADFARFNDIVFDAMWRTPRNLGDAAVLAALLAEHGFDADAFAALVADPEVKARLVATTDEAVQRGVFGAPTFFVGAEMFWGNDRLDFVEEALAG